MTSVKVRYIGAKAIKEDNIARTGAVWNGNGDIQSVPLAAWPQLCKHTTVWELVEDDEEPQPKRSLASEVPKAEVLAPIAEAKPVFVINSLSAIDSPLGAVNSDSIIVDTSVQDATIDIGGTPVQLGLVVAKAQASSGLTVSEWNELGEDDRDDFIATEIEMMREADAEAKEKAAAEALANSPKPTAEELEAGKPARAARGTGKRAKAAKGEES